ncbi:MAG: hypothetical protein EWM73_03026 [Nitrospira sp.]|nr:MAG: hypothetical protein EWM73_03026 [Nitrospira sp.]
MIVVDKGSSTGRPSNPKAPPPAPVAATASLWRNSQEFGCGLSSSVSSAAWSAVSSDFLVASLTTCAHFSGSSLSAFSIGMPINPVIFAARPGFSRSAFAYRRAS